MTHDTPTPPFQRLNRLIEKATARAQSTADPLTAIDMRVAAPRWWVPRPVSVRIVSEVFHGEAIALRLCERLAAEIDDPTAHTFLALQRADEQRHVSAYHRYLEHLGDIRPMGEAMAIVEAGADEAPGGALGRMTICHVILESEAIRLHEELTDILACPALDTMNALIGPDEARHVAFGTLYLRDRLPAIDRGTRLAIGRHAQRVWHAAARAVFDRTVGTKLIPRRLVEDRLARAWPRHLSILQTLGLA